MSNKGDLQQRQSKVSGDFCRASGLGSFPSCSKSHHAPFAPPFIFHTRNLNLQYPIMSRMEAIRRACKAIVYWLVSFLCFGLPTIILELGIQTEGEQSLVSVACLTELDKYRDQNTVVRCFALDGLHLQMVCVYIYICIYDILQPTMAWSSWRCLRHLLYGASTQLETNISILNWISLLLAVLSGCCSKLLSSRTASVDGESNSNVSAPLRYSLSTSLTIKSS